MNSCLFMNFVHTGQSVHSYETRAYRRVCYPISPWIRITKISTGRTYRK